MPLPSTLLRAMVTTTKLNSSMLLILPNVVKQSRRTFIQTVRRSTLIHELNVKDLKDECRKRGLKVSGKKLELQQRLQTYESNASSHDLDDVKIQLNEAQSQVEKLESQINTVTDEVAHHEEHTALDPQHLQKDSNKVESVVDELKQVQEQLNSLKTQATTMNKDVEVLLNKDGGDITFSTLPNNQLENSTIGMSDIPNVNTLKNELDVARNQAERLQVRVESELQAAIRMANTKPTSTTEPEEHTTTTTPQQQRNDGKKYILSILGATLGLGWIFQDSLIDKDPVTTMEDDTTTI